MPTTPKINSKIKLCTFLWKRRSNEKGHSLREKYLVLLPKNAGTHKSKHKIYFFHQRLDIDSFSQHYAHSRKKLIDIANFTITIKVLNHIGYFKLLNIVSGQVQ